MANLTLRSVKGSPLTNTEMDGNFEYFTGSYTNNGSITAQGFIGSFTGSLSGSVLGTTTSASYAATASYVNSLKQTLTISGSILVSGSIIPNTPSGSTTSSFSLGSPTSAWKDIYVSNGTINFLDGAGNTQGTLSSTANGIATSGDAYFNSTRVGQGPITGSANTVLGETALNSAIAGAAYNTAIGNATLFSLTTGENNTAIGTAASQFNTSGSRNTSVGAAALFLNSTGYDNTAVGWNSLLGIGTGYRNTALGTAAGNNASTTSQGNVYIGYNAGPTSSLAENNKLYINNTSSITPLIGGDFSTGVATINSILQLQRRTTNPGSPVEGMIMASGSAGSSKLYYYNGSTWTDLTA